MPWDYNIPIKEYFQEWSFDAESATLYNYDMWGNIHYGFIGLASLFTAAELFVGAAGAQIRDQGWKWVLEHGPVDDKDDGEAIQLGMNLWNTLKRPPSTREIVDAVRDAAPRLKTFRCSYR